MCDDWHMSDQEKNLCNKVDFVLECLDLTSAQRAYMQTYGFDLEMIYPADDPRVAVLAGHGIRIQLQQAGAAPAAPAVFRPQVVVTRRKEHTFGEGRAGMQYRDLIPGRLGGKYIASHIRIPTGGPVADYVHHHHIQFQLIYCYKGWVRVVYEDQGLPFVMQAGDCVLQPPHIRHRVLESSDAMEVIEIASPAEHETYVEREIDLPTDTIDATRKFSGQTFVLHRADDCRWTASNLTGFEMRDAGISRATGGLASAAVMRAANGTTSTACTNNQELYFNFILHGSLDLTIDKEATRSLQAGDSFVIPPASSITLCEIAAATEILQVTSPA